MSEPHDYEVVNLMRGPVSELRRSPDHALRLVMRLSGQLALYHAQVRQLLGLNQTDYAALMAVWNGGRCSMTELGRRLGGYAPASVSTLVVRLEKTGYLERANDGDDRRRAFLMVTRAFEDAMFQHSAALDRSLRQLATSDEWDAFGVVAAKLWQASGDAAGELRDELRAQKRPGTAAPAPKPTTQGW